MSISRAFTLVEILIVVVLLGILAALIVPNMVSAVGESSITTTKNELHKLRRHVEYYKARTGGGLPNVAAGNGTWGELISVDHLMYPPANAWVGGANRRVVELGNAPDAVYHKDYAWIYDPANGNIWAASFDADDEPIQP